jgi:hypothetical protein
MVEGEGEGTLHSTPTHPHTHVCMCVHILRLNVHRQSFFCTCFLLHFCIICFWYLVSSVRMRWHALTHQHANRALSLIICIYASIYMYICIYLHIHMVEGGKCMLTLNKPQMCINLVNGMQIFGQKIYNSKINKIQIQMFGTKRSVYICIYCLRSWMSWRTRGARQASM